MEFINGIKSTQKKRFLSSKFQLVNQCRFAFAGFNCSLRHDDLIVARRREEGEAEERNARKKTRVPTCLAAVIATAELNRKRTGARIKGDERCEKEENGQEEEAGRDRPTNQTLLDFPPFLLHLPTTRKGGCSRRSACRLTRHIIILSPLVSPVYPSSSVPLTAPSFPSRPPPPLVPVSSPFHLLR